MDIFVDRLSPFLCITKLVTNLSIVMDKLSIVIDKFVYKFVHYPIVYSLVMHRNSSTVSTKLYPISNLSTYLSLRSFCVQRVHKFVHNCPQNCGQLSW